MVGLYHRQEIGKKLMEIAKKLCCCCNKSTCNKSVQSFENGELQPEQFELLPVTKNEDGGSEHAV